MAAPRIIIDDGIILSRYGSDPNATEKDQAPHGQRHRHPFHQNSLPAIQSRWTFDRFPAHLHVTLITAADNPSDKSA